MLIYGRNIKVGEMNYYIHNDLQSMWERIEKSSYVDYKDNLYSWLKLMEDGEMLEITSEKYPLVINSERLSDEERDEDEKNFSIDLEDNCFRLPILIKDSKGGIVLLYGRVHLEKMLEEKGVSKVWVIKRERWKE